MEVGLKEFFGLLLTGTDEEISSCEIKEEEKISCEDMIIACKALASIGVTTKELIKGLSLLPGRRK